MRLRTRIIRSALAILAILILVPALLLAGAQTGPGRRLIASLVERLASTGDNRVAIGGIEGGVPWDMTVTGITLSDAKGQWLAIDRARLDWSPWALLQGRVEVALLQAGVVALDRLPAASRQAPPDAGPLIPDLPVDVAVARIVIEAFKLGPGVIGQAATLTAEGSARLGDPGEGLRAQLKVRRTDGGPALALDLDAAFVPAGQALAAHITLTDAPGGLLATLAGLPADAALTASVEGSGPLDAWRGRIDAAAGEGFGIAGRVTVDRRPDGRVVGLSGTAAIASLLPPGGRPLAADGVTLDVAALVGEGPIRLDHASLKAAAGTLTIAGTVDPAGERLDLTVRIAAGEPAVFSGLLPGAAWASAVLEGSVQGPLAAPAVDARLSAASPAFGAIRADSLTIALRGEPLDSEPASGAAVAARLTAEVTGLDAGIGEPGSLIGPAPALTAEGQVSLDGTVRLAAARLTLAAGTVDATGRLGGWGEEAELSVTAAVPALSALGPLLAPAPAGSLDLAVDLRRTGGRIEGGVRAQARGLALGIPEADGLVGEAPTLAFGFAVARDGSLSIDDLVLAGEAARLDADGVLEGGAVALGWTAAIDRLGALHPALSGRASLSGDVSGPVGSPTIAFSADLADAAAAGIAIPAARITALGRDLAGAPSGTVSLTATAAGLPVEASAALSPAPGGGARIDGLAVRAASAELSGALAVSSAGLVDGTLAGRVGALADFAALAGQPLSGEADVAIALDGAGGRQGVNATVDGRRIALEGTARAATLTARLAASDVRGAPTIEAGLDATGVLAGGLSLSRLSATAAGAVDGATAFTLEASGSDLTLRARGQAVRAEPLSVTLAALDGTWQGQAFSLTRPATVVVPAGGALSIRDVRLSVAGGSLTLDAGMGSGALDATLAARALPLSLIELAAPGLAVSGTADADLRLTGTPAAPRAEATVRLRNVRQPQAATAGIAGGEGTVQATWAGGRLEATAEARLTSAGTVTARLVMPMPGAPLPSPSPGAAIQGSIRARIDIGFLNDALAAGADRVDGALAADLTLAGTLARPSASGTITLADGRYANSRNGVDIRGIRLRLQAAGEALTIAELTARTPEGGSITGSGRIAIDPEAGFPADIQIQLARALAVATDLASVTVDGSLRLAGPVLSAPALSGTVTVLRAEIRVPDRLPPSIATIDVREINLPENIAQQRELRARSAPGGGIRLGLDLDVAAPREVFIRGRGIDVEIGGALDITGAAAAPRISGTLEYRRGRLDVLGKRFTFSRGTVQFLGEARIDPLLDLVAETRSGDTTIFANVDGRASSPEITFTSSPELPQEEVLSRLLFNKRMSQLTPLEAVQLAQSAAQLAGLGGGPGLMDRIRERLGIDRLEVESGAQGEGPSVKAGSYIGEGVYVGVQQGSSPNSSRVGVEIEVTPNVRIQSDVGADASGRVGFTVEFEY